MMMMRRRERVRNVRPNQDLRSSRHTLNKQSNTFGPSSNSEPQPRESAHSSSKANRVAVPLFHQIGRKRVKKVQRKILLGIPFGPAAFRILSHVILLSSIQDRVLNKDFSSKFACSVPVFELCCAAEVPTSKLTSSLVGLLTITVTISNHRQSWPQNPPAHLNGSRHRRDPSTSNSSSPVSTVTTLRTWMSCTTTWHSSLTMDRTTCLLTWPFSNCKSSTHIHSGISRHTTPHRASRVQLATSGDTAPTKT